MLMEVKTCGEPIHMVKCGTGDLKMKTGGLKIKTWILQKHNNVKIHNELLAYYSSMFFNHEHVSTYLYDLILLWEAPKPKQNEKIIFRS